MRFKYANPGVRTVEEAVLSGLDAVSPGILPAAVHQDYADELLAEVRSILTGELSTLFDRAGIATEFNEAIELAIRLVDGELQ